MDPPHSNGAHTFSFQLIKACDAAKSLLSLANLFIYLIKKKKERKKKAVGPRKSHHHQSYTDQWVP